MSEAGDYARPLEMVRLAPSATNAQPLACAQGKRCLSLLRVLYKQGLSEREELIKHVDLGIALSHFHQTALEHGLTGTFESLPQNDITLPDKMHYILSWHVGKEE